jgi:hypothetical protein
MAGMKITLDAALRARDVSRPTAGQDELASLSQPPPPEHRDRTAEPRTPPGRADHVAGSAAQASRPQLGRRRSDRGQDEAEPGTRHGSEPGSRQRGGPTGQDPGGPTGQDPGGPPGKDPGGPTGHDRGGPPGQYPGGPPARDAGLSRTAPDAAPARPAKPQPWPRSRTRRRSRLDGVSRPAEQAAGPRPASQRAADGQGNGGSSPVCS